MKNPMRGCGPFVHDDPSDRPPRFSAAGPRFTSVLAQSSAGPVFRSNGDLHPYAKDRRHDDEILRILALARVLSRARGAGAQGPGTEEMSINLLQGAQHGDAYKAVNPQSVVPALVIDDGPPLFQSLAIIEYLEETCPEPPLLPRDPRGRARVAGSR